LELYTFKITEINANGQAMKEFKNEKTLLRIPP